MTEHEDNHETLPEAVIERLAATDRRVSMLTPHVDRAVSQAALAQFAAREAPPRGSPGPLWGMAAAAAAALVFFVVTLREPSLRDAAPLPAAPAAAQFAATGDYDGSGTVDVLDAWRLSRELAANPRFAAGESVENLMQRIVALDGAVQ